MGDVVPRLRDSELTFLFICRFAGLDPLQTLINVITLLSN